MCLCHTRQAVSTGISAHKASECSEVSELKMNGVSQLLYFEEIENSQESQQVENATPPLVNLNEPMDAVDLDDYMLDTDQYLQEDYNLDNDLELVTMDDCEVSIDSDLLPKSQDYKKATPPPSLNVDESNAMFKQLMDGISDNDDDSMQVEQSQDQH
jgi:hypothetical protein